MRTQTFPLLPIRLQSHIDYGRLTLQQLAERITDNGDLAALNELHDNRFVFRNQQKHPIRLVDYLAGLMDSRMAKYRCGGDDSVLADAYNLTIDKFCNLPTEQADPQQQEPFGSDCRYYYHAFLSYVKGELKATSPHNAIESEILLAQILRRLVKYHFFRSCQEAKRRAQKFKRRYVLKIGGKILYLWLPWDLTGQHCRQWLGANVPDIDPQRPGEQDRIQAIIDRRLIHRNIYYLSELDRTAERLPSSPDSMLSTLQQDQISVKGLAEAVAIEKAENITQQRRTIQRLGEEKLKQLIRMIFTGLANGEYVEKEIASCFGLSRATLSRFAGSHFRYRCEDAMLTTIPDLWRNTAGVLSSHPDFVIATQRSGMWKRIRRVSTAEDAGEGL